MWVGKSTFTLQKASPLVPSVNLQNELLSVPTEGPVTLMQLGGHWEDTKLQM